MTGKILLKWVVGIILVCRGIYGAFDKEFATLLLIPLGLFIIPLSYKKLIEEKANLNLTTKTKWIVSIVGILLFVVVDIATAGFSKDDFKKIQEKVARTEEVSTNVEVSTDEEVSTNSEVSIDEEVSTNSEVLNFMHNGKILISEPTLTGEYMSKLDLTKFKVFTVKVHNENGIEAEQRDKTLQIIGYEDLKGYYGNSPNYNATSSSDPDIIESDKSFEFMDSSGYRVGIVEFYNNVYDKKPECTYQILSTRRYIYENDKGKTYFQFVYPERLLKLCK